MIKLSFVFIIMFVFSALNAQPAVKPAVKHQNNAVSGNLGAVVKLADLKISFQPPANWKQAEKKLEWQSAAINDKSSNMNIKATPGAGQTDSLLKNKDAFVKMLKNEYAKIKQGKFQLLKNDVETFSGKKVIVTYGLAEMAKMKMKNIQVFFETPEKIIIFTFTTLAKDWDKNLSTIKASLNSIKFQ